MIVNHHVFKDIINSSLVVLLSKLGEVMELVKTVLFHWSQSLIFVSLEFKLAAINVEDTELEILVVVNNTN